MSAISLINSGVAWFVAAAVLAFLFSFQKALSGWIAGIGGAVGSLYTAAAGFTVLTGAVGVSGALSLVSYDVQISPLNAIWLITLGLCGLFVSLYNIDWHRHAQVKCNGLQINMLMAAAVCAVIASNLGMFVVMAEIMALCAVFLTSNSKRANCGFALGRLGTLLLAIACWLLWQRYGTLDLRLLDMRMQQLPLGSDIWLLGVIGFGLLAGIIPLHGWVPQAHANASAPAAALFSTVVMKIGLLGILTLSLLGGNAPLWWDRTAGTRHDHRIRRRSVCVDGTQYPTSAGLPHPGKYRHYPAGAGRWRNGYRARTTGADCPWSGWWSVPSD